MLQFTKKILLKMAKTFAPNTISTSLHYKEGLTCYVGGPRERSESHQWYNKIKAKGVWTSPEHVTIGSTT